MTPEQCHLVRNSWNAVAPRADEAAIMFYERLFEIEPATRELFTHTEMAHQRVLLMQLVGAAVDGLDDVESLVPALEELGRRHAAYGVRAQHYDSVGEALLWTLERQSGPAWSPAVAEAWGEVYSLVAGVMRDAGEGQATV